MLKDNKIFRLITTFLLGVLFFILIYGLRTLNVQDVSWIYADMGDLFQHQLGWDFFRKADWHFPFGLYTSYPYPFQNSIIYTDSIPLFAVIFKLFNPLLPENFQYFGLFCALSFGLQAVFAELILRKLKVKFLLSLTILPIFFFNTVLLMRIFRHTSLGGGQWLILVAIYLWLNKDTLAFKKKILFWSILCGMSVTIHPYFVPMVSIFVLSDCIYSFLKSRKYKEFLIVFIPEMVSIFVFYLLGGFSVKFSTFHNVGLGLYSMNLNALFNPFNFSSYFQELPHGSGQAEGVNYLGISGILLLIFSLVTINFKKIQGYYINNKNHIKSVLLIVVPLFIMSLSPIIMLGNKVVLNYIWLLPDTIIDAWRTFRATGRLFWPCYYLILIFLIYNLNRFFLNKVKLGIFFVFLSFLSYFEVVDLTAYKYPKTIENERSFSCFLDDLSFLNKNLKHIVFIEKDVFKIYHRIAFFAARNNLTLSSGHFARFGNPNQEEYIHELNSGKLRKDSIYVIPKSSWNKSYLILKTKDIYAFLIQNYYIICDKNLIGKKIPEKFLVKDNIFYKNSF